MDIYLPLFVMIGVAFIFLTMIYIPMTIQKTFGKKFKDRIEIQNVLDSFRLNTNIERVLFFSCNNGKGLHEMGFQIKVTALYESVQYPFRSIMNGFNEFVLVGGDVRVLKDVYDNSVAAYFVDDMPDGLLKEVYQSEGVRWITFIRIGEDRSKEKFFYLTLATSQEESPYQLGQGGQIILGINKMRRINKKLNLTSFRRVINKYIT